MVLPEKEIKKVLMEQIFSKSKVNTVFDFGAGTLVWSEWFKQQVDYVYAVDIIFRKEIKNGISLLGGIDDVDDEFLSQIQYGGVLWLCDVFHHIDFEFGLKVLDCFSPVCKYIVIKDIDCGHRFGNFMNKMHDRIINGEKVRNINPVVYKEELSKRGFKTTCHFFRKLWYPHFLMIAEKCQ